MEQIDGHWVSLSRGVAQGLAHGIISYGHSHEMIVVIRSSRDTWHMIRPSYDFSYWDFERQGVAPPLHQELSKPETRNVKSPEETVAWPCGYVESET
jgi:hypothetical protein